ncbi:MAG: YtxH domain-containing protein [Deltaproteobacteria bacterium]
MDESDDKVLTGALLVLAGAVLGAGVALLFAPQSGRETRKDIGRYARKVRRKVEGAGGEVVDAVTGMAEAVEEKAEELAKRGAELARDSREAVLSALDEGQERLGRQRDRLAKIFG